MTLFDEGLFRLDDPVQKYLPEFRGQGRDKITMRQLMTHVSGLPDQLPENARLRATHAPLSEFVSAATRTPLLFQPGAKYSYSSMAILLATEVAQRLSGRTIADLTQERLYDPLGMHRSAMGLGKFQLSDMVMNQVERAAPESGAGDPSTKSWDWNSKYWRELGAPWGAAHGSAEDVAIILTRIPSSNRKDTESRNDQDDDFQSESPHIAASRSWFRSGANRQDARFESRYLRSHRIDGNNLLG